MLSQPQVKFNSLTRACSSHENPFVITCPLSSHPLPFPSLPFSLSPPHPAFSRGHKSKYDALPGYLRFSLSVKRLDALSIRDVSHHIAVCFYNCACFLVLCLLRVFLLQDNMELQSKQSKAVAVTCMSFMAGDVNNFVVGSEEGSVHTACRHGA